MSAFEIALLAMAAAWLCLALWGQRRSASPGQAHHLVAFKDYEGNDVLVNPEMVQSVSEFQHYAPIIPKHDPATNTWTLPPEWASYYELDADRIPQIKPELYQEMYEKLTSTRVVVVCNNLSWVIDAPLGEVRRKLGLA